MLSVFLLTGVGSLIANRKKFVAVDSNNYFGVAMHFVADVLNWIACCHTRIATHTENSYNFQMLIS